MSVWGMCVCVYVVKAQNMHENCKHKIGVTFKERGD